MTKRTKKVLIAGAAGFIGRIVSRYFSERGWNTIGIDSIPCENAPVMHLFEYHQIHLPHKSIEGILKENCPDVVINSSGRSSVPLSFHNPEADFMGNTVLTQYLLDACRTNSPESTFINISSAAVYGNPRRLPVGEDAEPAPISPYGFHKLVSELICREYSEIFSMRAASVRIFSAYGPGLRRQVLWDICQKALSSQHITLQGTGRESRDFIHAYDIARAFEVLAESAPMNGEVYNLGSGQETTISELSSLLLGFLDYKGELSFDGHVPKGAPLKWKADIEKISLLGFAPSIPLKQGAEAFALWCRSEFVRP
jgi:UDP-glucose 4-epimerase